MSRIGLLVRLFLGVYLGDTVPRAFHRFSLLPNVVVECCCVVGLVEHNTAWHPWGGCVSVVCGISRVSCLIGQKRVEHACVCVCVCVYGMAHSVSLSNCVCVCVCVCG